MPRRQAGRAWAVSGTLLLFAVVLTASPRRSSARQSSGSPEAAAFPLQAGTYWVYQGIVTSASENPTEGQEKAVQWKMSVEKVVRRGNLFAAVVSGFPRELDWSQGDTKPAQSLIVKEGAKYYWIPAASFAQAMARLQNPKDMLDDLMTDDELFLDLPLFRGKKFCDAAGMLRTDDFYCWVANEPQAADLSGAKGIPPGEHTAFPVRFMTMPDTTEFDFVPGIGITSYSYQHHGTIAETELHLAEFHVATPQ